jgi:hypothetical protein
MMNVTFLADDLNKRRKDCYEELQRVVDTLNGCDQRLQWDGVAPPPRNLVIKLHPFENWRLYISIPYDVEGNRPYDAIFPTCIEAMLVYNGELYKEWGYTLGLKSFFELNQRASHCSNVKNLEQEIAILKKFILNKSESMYDW